MYTYLYNSSNWFLPNIATFTGLSSFPLAVFKYYGRKEVNMFFTSILIHKYYFLSQHFSILDWFSVIPFVVFRLVFYCFWHLFMINTACFWVPFFGSNCLSLTFLYILNVVSLMSVWWSLFQFYCIKYQMGGIKPLVFLLNPGKYFNEHCRFWNELSSMLKKWKQIQFGR